MTNIACKVEETIEPLNMDDQIIKYIREQRHDFLNYIQVIWGYLQLNHPKEALDYINDLNKKFESTGRLLKIENPEFALFLYEYIKRAYKIDVSVDVEVETESIPVLFQKRWNDIAQIMSGWFDEILKRTASKLKEKYLFIDIFMEEGLFYVSVSNSSDGQITMNYNKDCSEYKMMDDTLKVSREIGAEIQYIINGSDMVVKFGFVMVEA